MELQEKAFRETAVRCMRDPSNTPVEAFLLSYKSYCRKVQLLDVWLGLLAEAAEEKSQGKPEGLRGLLEFLRVWLRQYFTDFTKSQWTVVLAKIREHAGTASENEFKLIFLQAQKKAAAAAADQQSKEATSCEDEPSVSDDTTLPNAARYQNVIASFKINFKVSGITAYVIAKQLTWREIDLFKKITPREFLDQNWQNEDKGSSSPNLTDNIDKFNEVSFWVCTAILCSPSPADQASLIRKFIKVAHKCCLWNNYNGVMEVLSGLGNTAIARLKDSWGLLPEKTTQKFEKLEQLMSPHQNFKFYRERFRETASPKLPYLAVILRDITFINVGNEKYLREGGLNFDRFVLLHEQIKEVQKLQAESDGYDKIFGQASDAKNQRLTYFDNLPFIDDDDVLYEMSQKCGGTSPKGFSLSVSGAPVPLPGSWQEDIEGSPLTNRNRSCSETALELNSKRFKFIDATKKNKTEDSCRNSPLQRGPRTKRFDGYSKRSRRGSKESDYEYSERDTLHAHRTRSGSESSFVDDFDVDDTDSSECCTLTDEYSETVSDNSVGMGEFLEAARDQTRMRSFSGDSLMLAQHLNLERQQAKRLSAGYSSRLRASSPNMYPKRKKEETKKRASLDARRKAKSGDTLSVLLEEREGPMTDASRGTLLPGRNHGDELNEVAIVGKKHKSRQQNLSGDIMAMDDEEDSGSGASKHSRESRDKKDKKDKKKKKKKRKKEPKADEPGRQKKKEAKTLPTEASSPATGRQVLVKASWKGQVKLVPIPEGCGFATFLHTIFKKYSIPLGSAVRVCQRGKDGTESSMYINDAQSFMQFIETCGTVLVNTDKKTTRYCVWLEEF